MENKILEEIANDTAAKLNAHFGYCGVARDSHFTMLNTEDAEGRNIIITIKLDKDD